MEIHAGTIYSITETHPVRELRDRHVQPPEKTGVVSWDSTVLASGNRVGGWQHRHVRHTKFVIPLVETPTPGRASTTTEWYNPRID